MAFDENPENAAKIAGVLGPDGFQAVTQARAHLKPPQAQAGLEENARSLEELPVFLGMPRGRLPEIDADRQEQEAARRDAA